jgi:hypothetical protein
MYFSRVLTATIKLHHTDSRRFCVMETAVTRAILATDRDAPPGSTLGVKHDNHVLLSVSWASRREATRYSSAGPPGTMCSARGAPPTLALALRQDGLVRVPAASAGPTCITSLIWHTRGSPGSSCTATRATVPDAAVCAHWRGCWR